MLTIAREYFSDLFNVFYPRLCLSCMKALVKGEDVLCIHCENDLPLTEYWKDSENRLMKRFWGRVPVNGAVALFQFKKGGGVQHILHELKYRGRTNAGTYCGKRLGYLLKSNTTVIKNIDLIVPVPLFWKKEKVRGYNQCDSFASGLSEVLSIPWSSTALERIQENVSQTKKQRFDRWGNVSEIFCVKDASQLQGKHILLVDDVVTTGATSEACMQTILTIPETTVSFAAIAAAV